MARTERTASKITRTGLIRTMTAVDAANGEMIPLVSGKTMFLEVANGSGSSINVSFVIKRTVSGVTPDPAVAAVAAGVTKDFGPFPSDDYEQADGDLYVDYSSGTTITAMARYI